MYDMKGPYERLKYDLRRVWECPDCQHRERTAGSVTSQFCRCQRKKKSRERVAMRLIQDGLRRATTGE
jgi:hypothetical protein